MKDTDLKPRHIQYVLTNRIDLPERMDKNDVLYKPVQVINGYTSYKGISDRRKYIAMLDEDGKRMTVSLDRDNALKGIMDGAFKENLQAINDRDGQSMTLSIAEDDRTITIAVGGMQPINYAMRSNVIHKSLMKEVVVCPLDGMNYYEGVLKGVYGNQLEIHTEDGALLVSPPLSKSKSVLLSMSDKEAKSLLNKSVEISAKVDNVIHLRSIEQYLENSIVKDNKDRPVNKYVLTSNKDFHPKLNVHNILGREVPEMIAPAQSVTGKFCGIKNGRLEGMEQTITLLVDDRHVEVVTGKFGAFTRVSKQEKTALTLAGKKGTEATLSMNEDDTAITLSIKDGISITEPIHNIDYESLVDKSVKQEVFEGKLFAVDGHGPLLINDAGEVIHYREKAGLNKEDIASARLLFGKQVQVSVDDKLNLVIKEKNKQVKKDIEKKHFYVLTHRTDLQDNVDTFKEGQCITHPVQSVSGKLNNLTSSGFVLKQGEEHTVVYTNKLLSADLVKALNKADTVQISLDKSGTLLTVSYLDGKQEAQKRAGKQVEPQVVTQKFNSPAIPFGVIKDVDLTKPENQQKVFYGALQNVYGTKDKQILELKSANGTRLVHGFREATSEATLRKFIGQDVKVQGFDGGLRMTPEKSSPEVSLNQR